MTKTKKQKKMHVQGKLKNWLTFDSNLSCERWSYIFNLVHQFFVVGVI